MNFPGSNRRENFLYDRLPDDFVGKFCYIDGFPKNSAGSSVYIDFSRMAGACCFVSGEWGGGRNLLVGGFGPKICYGI